jgi:hypothetical protein
VKPVVDALAERLADDEEFYYVRARSAEALGYVAVDSPEGVTDPETLADLRIGLEFDSVPETAVGFDDQWADMLVTLGQDDRLIAHGRPGNIITEFYDQLPNVSFDSEGLTTLSDNMSVETFFELDADVHHLDPLRLAATWDGFDDSDVETVRDQISPYFANRYSAYRNYTGDESCQYCSIWELTRKFAELYQVPDRVAALEGVYDEVVAEIQSNLPPESERPRVALSVHSDGTFYGQPSITNPGFARAHIRPLQAWNAFTKYPQYEGFGVQYDIEAMVVLDGEYGYEDTAFGVPVKLGSDGVEEILEWELDDYETELMDEAAEKLFEQYEKIA